MKKHLLLLILLSVLYIKPIYAQQQYYDWQISAGVGAMTYYGDLTYKLKAIKMNVPAYQFTLGRNISPSFALLLQTQFGKISANDRAQDWNNNLLTANPNFTRALNFQTDIRNANLLLSYRLNNGKILSRYAAVGPYVFAGVGVTDFTVFGDLFNANGQRYHYWSDNTIRNLPENPANASQAQIIGQDGKFETQLSGLQTENNNYPTTVLNIPVGAGIKFRLSERWSANIQSTINYAFTGYLDDVKGAYSNDYTNELQAYAANPSALRRDMRGNDKNDVFVSAVVSLSYHFNLNRKKFEAPMVYTGYQAPMAAVSQKSTADIDANEPDDNRLDSIQPIIAPELKFPVKKPVAADTAIASKSATTPDKSAQVSPGVTSNPGADRQTVDVNVRIFIERGDSIAYESRATLKGTNAIQDQALQSRPETSFLDTMQTNLDTIGTDVSLNSVYNRARINALNQELNALKREVQSYRTTTADTANRNVVIDSMGREPIPRSKQNLQPDTNLQPGTDSVQKQQSLQNNPQQAPKPSSRQILKADSAQIQRNLQNNQPETPQRSDREALLNRRIDSLTNEIRTLEAQPQQNVRANTYRNPAGNNTGPARTQLQNTPQNAPIQQNNYDQELQTLRRELDEVKNELSQQRYLAANATQRYQAPPRDRTSVITVPSGITQNRYDEEEMSRLRSELSTVKEELNSLQTQEKSESNPELTNKIDSLLNLVSTIDSVQQFNERPQTTRPTVDANAPDTNTSQANNEQLMNTLRSQITDLNESLGTMRSRMESKLSEIENAPPPAPLSTLGNTVVYYNINEASLKQEDKDRLAILANRLKADSAILLNVKGYADQTGNAAYNLALSKKRAENIRQYFINDMGVNPDQILINYYGQQISDGPTKNPYDRKVELQLFRENAMK